MYLPVAAADAEARAVDVAAAPEAAAVGEPEALGVAAVHAARREAMARVGSVSLVKVFMPPGKHDACLVRREHVRSCPRRTRAAPFYWMARGAVIARTSATTRAPMRKRKTIARSAAMSRTGGPCGSGK